MITLKYFQLPNDRCGSLAQHRLTNVIMIQLNALDQFPVPIIGNAAYCTLHLGHAFFFLLSFERIMEKDPFTVRIGRIAFLYGS